MLKVTIMDSVRDLEDFDETKVFNKNLFYKDSARAAISGPRFNARF